YAAGSDGNLYRFVWTEGGVWQTPVAIHSAVAAAPGPVDALTWTQGAAGQTGGSSAVTRYEAIYVIRADGHLYEYLSPDGATWQQTDLSAQAGAAPAVVGAPSAYTFVPAGAQ